VADIYLQANKKTRNRAYDLLIEIARACEDTGSDERKESLHQFFDMVLLCQLS
jgi:ribosomal RNA-processing protein 12